MNTELLKSDEHGRVRTPRERREQLLDEFERCGTSAAAFARIVGVKYQTFIRWVHLRRLERSSAMTSSESGALGFVEAVAASGVDGGAGLRVELPGGARMEIHAPHQDRFGRGAVACAGFARRTRMLSFTGSLRVFLAVEPCDMRKGFNGLHALVSTQLQEEVRSGALFVFTNRSRTRLKVLYFDGTGLWVLSKRLEKGTFAWPKREEIAGGKLALRPEYFAMLTDGLDWREAKARPWLGRS